MGFSRRRACLAVIARDTRADNVLPHVLAAPGTGYDVVQSQLFCLASAILACEPITVEHGLTGEPAAHQRTPDHINKPNHRRYGKGPRNAANMASPIHHQLSLAASQKYESPLGVADVEGLVILVEHQDR